MAVITPLIPPRMKLPTKPSANSMPVFSRWTLPSKRVATQEKILIPVGTAISAEVIIIGTRSQANIPETNMWCAQTLNERTTIPSREIAISR